MAGEPILVPELLMTANVTPIDQVTRYASHRSDVFLMLPVFKFC